jgi:hypothetical protein
MTEVTDKVRLEKIKKENERIIMRVFGVGCEKFCNMVLYAVLSIDLYFFSLCIPPTSGFDWILL